MRALNFGSGDQGSRLSQNGGDGNREAYLVAWARRNTVDYPFKRRIKSLLPFAGIIRSSPYSPR